MREKKTFRFDAKASNQEEGRFSGKASVYGVLDFHGDVVMPGAFTKSLQKNGPEIVVLNQHDTRDPIGRASLTDSAEALLADGQLVLDLDSAKQAYIRVKNNLVTGISIGYETLDAKFVNGIRQLTEINLFEISLVTMPANDFARVTDVKEAVAAFENLAGFNVDACVERMGWLVSELKAGRTLSAANLNKLMAAMDAITAATSSIKAVVDTATPEADEKRTVLESLKSLAATAKTFIK